uniref:Uncharacterized protein n=1 Tax=Trichogramma kaykai TaxID=54128 RepID=A0ABD2WW77_9HYME
MFRTSLHTPVADFECGKATGSNSFDMKRIIYCINAQYSRLLVNVVIITRKLMIDETIASSSLQRQRMGFKRQALKKFVIRQVEKRTYKYLPSMRTPSHRSYLYFNRVEKEVFFPIQYTRYRFFQP